MSAEPVVVPWANHGTYRGYSIGCRCTPCRNAKAAYSRERRAATKTPAQARVVDRASVAGEYLSVWDAGYSRGRDDVVRIALLAIRSPMDRADVETLLTQMTTGAVT